MFWNYLKVAWRTILSTKTISFITVFGLALGLAGFLVIGTWVYQELSYDRHFKDSDRIYRVGVNFMNLGEMASGPPIFHEVAEGLPEVETVSSMDYLQGTEILAGQNRFGEERVFAADPTFFELFSYDFIAGDPASALGQPGQAVVTEATALKLFGRRDVVGEQILVGEGEVPHSIAGIIRDPVGNSHLNGNIWISLDYDEQNLRWTSAQYYHYLMLRDGFDRSDLEQRLQQVIRDRVYPTLDRSEPYEEWIAGGSAYRFLVTPLTDLYLKSDLRLDFFVGGNATRVFALASVGFFMLLLAVINFVNMLTARASHRAKEVGIRKTLGSQRGALVKQFLVESVMTSLLSVVLAFALGLVFLRLFESVTDTHILDSLVTGWEQVLVVVGVAVSAGIAGGLYPAFYLSAFRPVSILSGYFAGMKNSWFRNGLVVGQFTVSLCLVIGTLVIYDQLEFMKSKDLGFDTEQILIVDNANLLGAQREIFKGQAAALNGVTEAGISSRVPYGMGMAVRRFRSPEVPDGKTFQYFAGDAHYVRALNYRILEGRSFSDERAGEVTEVLLSESAVRELSLENPIGYTFENGMRVVGIVADFHFQSLDRPAEPTALIHSRSGGHLAIRMDGAQADRILSQLSDIWQSFSPEEAISYYFLDRRYGDTLESEQALGNGIAFFSIVAILISCMGLFGLSIFICNQRSKEIGIRKIFGATTGRLVLALNRDFTLLILISVIAAVPLSYIAMNRWLSDFAYKVAVDPFLFLFAGLGVLFIAWLTVSSISVRTAWQNPVESIHRGG